MLSALLGLLCALAGAWGFWHWRSDFLLLAKGLVPVSMIFAGAVAIAAGLSNLRKNG